MADFSYVENWILDTIESSRLGAWLRQYAEDITPVGIFVDWAPYATWGGFVGVNVQLVNNKTKQTIDSKNFDLDNLTFEEYKRLSKEIDEWIAEALI